jgi:hypothetical protein
MREDNSSAPEIIFGLLAILFVSATLVDMWLRPPEPHPAATALGTRIMSNAASQLSCNQVQVPPCMQSTARPGLDACELSTLPTGTACWDPCASGNGNCSVDHICLHKPEEHRGYCNQPSDCNDLFNFTLSGDVTRIDIECILHQCQLHILDRYVQIEDQQFILLAAATHPRCDMYLPQANACLRTASNALVPLNLTQSHLDAHIQYRLCVLSY